MVVMNILRWLRGTVDFTATGKFPERFINLALREDIALINPIGEKGKLSSTTFVSDYRDLRQVARKSGVKLHIQKKHGLPFVIHKNKNRSGLLAGAVLFIVIVQILSMFIWSVEIVGQDTVSTTRIRQSLESNGVRVGAYKGGINVQETERKITLDLGQVGWMSINLIGTDAYVELSESVKVPEILPLDKPCNLKAVKGGQIVKLEVANGDKKVKIGDGVAKGQLLVSGIMSDADSKMAYFVHSSGKVLAAVHEEKQIAVNKVKQCNLPTGAMIQQSQLRLFNFGVPLGLAAVPQGTYNRQIWMESMVINGNTLPIDVVTHKNYAYEMQTISCDSQTAEKICHTRTALTDVFYMWDKNIISETAVLQENDKSYIYNVVYSTIENIAVKAPIELLD